MSDATAFLAARRSVPARMLTAPAPDRAALQPILTAALRVPDHGKLEPWRLIVIEAAALGRLSALVAERGAALGLDAEQVEKARSSWAGAPLIVAVVSRAAPHPKIPEGEQILSAGALCMNVVNAARAAGWGAAWLTGWPAYDRGFVEGGLGLGATEQVAGLVHIGTPPADLPPDRPRPDPARAVTWIAA
jgi:nitroreductase